MKNLFLTAFLVSIIISKNAEAKDCHFNYWEVIPKDKKCEVYYLPDFSFKKVEQSKEEKKHPAARFCSRYEINSKYGKQTTGYCYTGAGDRTGPFFRLGDEEFNFIKPSTTLDRVYMADLSFVGCFKGKKSRGVVFLPKGWKKSPPYIGRSMPLRGVTAKCKGN